MNSNKQDHLACRRLQSQSQTSWADAQKILTALQTTATANCNAVKELEKTQASQAKVCALNGAEAYSFYNARLKQYFTDLNQKWTALTAGCTKSTADTTAQDTKVKALLATLTSKTSECDKKQVQLDQAACELTASAKGSCTDADTCYTSKVADYNEVVKAARVQEIRMQSEWEALMRMQCLANAFGQPDTAKSAAIQAHDC